MLAEVRASAEADAKNVALSEKKRGDEQLRRAEGLVYAGKLSLTQSAFQEGNEVLVQQHLDECQWNLRGWEHRHLRKRFNSNQTFTGHTGEVLCLAYSPNGKWVVSGGESYERLRAGDLVPKPDDVSDDAQILRIRGELKVWDSETGQQKFTLKGHTAKVLSVAISPDGKRIVSGGKMEMKVWNAETGMESLKLEDRTRGHTSVAFSPDGKQIVSRSANGTVIVWNAETGQKKISLEGLGGLTDDVELGQAHSVAFSPDGKRIVSSGDGSELPMEGVMETKWVPVLKVWDAQNGEAKLTLIGRGSRVCSLAYSPDGERIVSSNGMMLEVWDAKTGQVRLALKGHTEDVRSVAYSHDGKHIVSGSGNRYIGTKTGEVKVWDANTGLEVFTLKGHTDGVNSVAFSADGKRIVSGSRDKTVKVWDAQQGQQVRTLEGHTNYVSSLAFSPNGKVIAAGSLELTADGRGKKSDTVNVWDADSGQVKLTLKGHTMPVASVAFSPDGNRIVTGAGGGLFVRGGKPGEIKVWDANTGREVLQFKGHSCGVLKVAFSHDGKHIITGGAESVGGEGGGSGAVKVWDANTGREVRTLKENFGIVTSLAVSPDGRRIASGYEHGILTVWDAETGKQALTLERVTKIIPEDEASNVPLIGIRRGGLGIGSVLGLAYSPDGKRIVTATGTLNNAKFGKMQVWNADTGEAVLTLEGHSDLVISVAFSGDGKRIVSGSFDKTVKVWDAETGLEVLTLKEHTQPVWGVAMSTDDRLVIAGGDGIKVLDADRGEQVRVLKGDLSALGSITFAPDGDRIFAWDNNLDFVKAQGEGVKVNAWSVRTGKPTDADNTPSIPPPGAAVSPDGFLRAEVHEYTSVFVTDKRLVNPNANYWRLPNAAQRKRYHTEQAALAMKQKQWFAAAFHLGRLLLDSPNDADLKRRRDDALKRHAAAKAAQVTPPRMEKVP